MDEFEELEAQRRALKAELNERFEAWGGEDAEADPAELPEGDSRSGAASAGNLDLLMDIPVRISMEVGGASLSVRELLQLTQGSVVELDRLAGEPLDVLVNGRLIAKGEVVVVDDQLGIRLTELASPSDRVHSLRRST